jgi:hypothetical protein
MDSVTIILLLLSSIVFGGIAVFLAIILIDIRKILERRK